MSANGHANGAANGDAPAAKKQKTEGTSLHDDHQCVLVLDYGSQYTQLICRRTREIGVFSMMFPGDASMVSLGCAQVPACCSCWLCPDTHLISVSKGVRSLIAHVSHSYVVPGRFDVQPEPQQSLCWCSGVVAANTGSSCHAILHAGLHLAGLHLAGFAPCWFAPCCGC
jgi:hypothetical protein